ncbi:MAG: hypothetical protein KME38_00855 [Spirirestis rafaelensis WJT71-NPBG6]|nr:hypothetical protein [Spirirestis rafaelensis WJT71-NPBG6]
MNRINLSNSLAFEQEKKMLNRLIASSSLITVILGATAFTTVATAQQGIARMRFVWNFPQPGGAIYMNICDEPDFNTDAESGGCANINVLNRVVTNNRSGTELITDRLKSGTPYKACLVTDNIYPRSQYERRGRWITCKVFNAQDKATIGFNYSDLKFVRERP